MENVLKQGKTAAIIMETIQGEGGDNHFRPEFFKGVRALADRYEAMFILDEVQCGMGLTGKWWAYEDMPGEARSGSTAGSTSRSKAAKSFSARARLHLP